MDPLEFSKYGWSPLHEAIRKKQLSESNIGSLKEDMGRFYAVYCLPIHTAIFVGDVKQIQILIANGADATAKMQGAEWSGKGYKFRYAPPELWCFGSFERETDGRLPKEKYTPIELARAIGREEVAKALEAALAGGK